MLQIAIVGCGKMGAELARRAERTGRARVVAVCDTNAEVCANRAAEFDAQPIPSVEGLRGLEHVDAFIVAPPGLYHYSCVMALASEGKPIFCEKPLATTAALCDEMIEASESHGVKLFVGQVLRLFPAFLKSLEIIESGVIGTPQMVSVTRAGRGMHYASGWRASLRESGGPLLETNAHEIDYLNALLGAPVSVYATGTNLNGWGDYNDSYFVQVKFLSGGVGMIHGSNASPLGEYRVHIQCTAGNLTHAGFGGEIRYRSFSDEVPVVVGASELEGMTNPYEHELLSFFNWVEDDLPPFFTGSTGRAVVAVADAVNRSFESNTVEPVFGASSGTSGTNGTYAPAPGDHD